jgi:hypothetical protein
MNIEAGNFYFHTGLKTLVRVTEVDRDGWVYVDILTGLRAGADYLAEPVLLEELSEREHQFAQAAFTAGARAMLEAITYKDDTGRYNKYLEPVNLLEMPEVKNMLFQKESL